MKRWLIIVGLSPLLGVQAEAAPKPPGLAPTVQPHGSQHRPLDLRLVDDPNFSPSIVRHSGMIAGTDVAPNASLGVGLLKGAPKSFGIGDTRPDGRTRGSRKAAVAFVLKF
jgi:hypothetical protein